MSGTFVCAGCGESSPVEVRCDRCGLAMQDRGGVIADVIALRRAGGDRLRKRLRETAFVVSLFALGLYLCATMPERAHAIIDFAIYPGILVAMLLYVGLERELERYRERRRHRRLAALPAVDSGAARPAPGWFRGRVRALTPSATADASVVLERRVEIVDFGNGWKEVELTRAGRFAVIGPDVVVLVPEHRARLLVDGEIPPAATVREGDEVEVLGRLEPASAEDTLLLGAAGYRDALPVFSASAHEGAVWLRVVSQQSAEPPAVAAEGS